MEIYAKYGPALLRKAERVLQNPDDARDVVQELFVDMLDRGQQEADLPYLYRAVTNRCLNVLRDRGNRERLLKLQRPALRGLARTALDDQVVSLDLLAKLTGRLDQRCQEVLVYRYIDDMTQEEISTVTGSSRKTVGRRLDKIRQKARALTGDAQGGVT